MRISFQRLLVVDAMWPGPLYILNRTPIHVGDETKAPGMIGHRISHHHGICNGTELTEELTYCFHSRLCW